MILNLLSIAANIIAILLLALVILSIKKGAPPVPTSRHALAQQGIQAQGYEINPFLVWWTKYRIKNMIEYQ